MAEKNAFEKFFQGSKAVDSNNSPLRSPVAIESQAFRSWFGASKAVSSNGKPLTLYHGTRSDITIVDMGKSERLAGFWMTPTPALASTYAAEGVVNALSYREGANVMPLYARIERPRIFHRNKEPMQMAWADYLEGDFDGFFEIDEDGSIYSVTVKTSSQVKSAIGNDASFDGLNPDIRFSRPEISSTRAQAAKYSSIPQGLVQLGYTLLPRGDARRFKSFGTWEKDGVRIALSNNVLGVERGAVMIYQADDREMTLEALITDPEQRGKGKATAALRELCTAADAAGQMLYLEPVQLDASGLDVFQLKGLYAAAGFKRLGGKALVMARDAGNAKTFVTESVEFPTWFGRSTVVHADGTPRIVYHGTHHDFSSFAHGDIGFHFGTAEAANRRLEAVDANGQTAGPRLIPVYLSIQNPLRLADAGDWNNPDMVATYVGEAIMQEVISTEAYEAALALVPKTTDQLAAFRAIFKTMGYDGIVYENVAEGGGDSYIAFEPEQIKSALGNNGQFASDDPDIRFSQARPENKTSVIEHRFKGSAVVNPDGTAILSTRSTKSAISSIAPSVPPSISANPSARLVMQQGAASQTLSALRAWMGNSVVVTPHGAPKMVFHATTADFSEFDPSLSYPSNSLGPGLYFTTDPKTLEIYSDSQLPEADGRLMPVFLRIERAQTDGALSAEQIEAFFDVLQVNQFPTGYDATADHARLKSWALANPSSAFNTLLSGQSAFIDAQDWLCGMAAMGIDGIIREVFGQPEYVVFGAQQVKSAIGNNGEFDPSNPDIRFSDSFSLLPEPLARCITAFHGTATKFGRFRSSKIGSFGSGIYFGDKKSADCYSSLATSIGGTAPRIIEARLYFNCPLEVQADYAAGEQMDFESPAVPLLKRLFGEKADAMIAHAVKTGAEGFGPEIQAEAIRQGYDGFILTYPDNSMEYVVFDARQISRVGLNLLSPDRTYQQRSVLSGTPGVMNSFAGSTAATANIDMRTSATKRVFEGEDANLVRQSTGWFMGMDGQWRFEIADDSAEVLSLLQNLHTGGFDARAIESVTYARNADGSLRVTLNPPNPRTLRDFVQLNHLSEDLIQALLPEAVIKQIKARAGREDYLGNLEDARCVEHEFDFQGFNALPLDLVLSHPALYQAYPALRNIAVKIDPRMGLGASLGTTSIGETVLTVGPAYPKQNLLHEIQHAIQNIEGFAQGGTFDIPVSRTSATPAEIAAADHYHRLAGEVEARNTVVRQAMTAAQRVVTPPDVTQDVDRARVIVKQDKASTGSLGVTMATPESVRVAVTQLFGNDFVPSSTGAAEILAVNSRDLGQYKNQTFSYSLMQNLASQNRNLSLITLRTLANTVIHAGAQAFYERRSGTITLVADRIIAGREKAVLMHELTHKHGRQALGQPAWQSLVEQVKAWRLCAPQSTERQIYNDALHRTASVKGLAEQTAVYDEELFAYAVESAITMGIRPSADALPHSAQAWLAEVISSIERVAHKLTGQVQSSLTTQDLVDLAYALAQLETPSQSKVIRQAFIDAGLNRLAEQRSMDTGALLQSQPGKTLSWYSSLARLVENANMQTGTAQAWKDLLKNASAKGVKPEEIQWSGLLQWLAQQTGRLNKTQVMEYLDKSGVQVQEVFLGGDSKNFHDAVDRLRDDGLNIDSDEFFGVELLLDGVSIDRQNLSERQRADLDILNDGMDAEDPLNHGSSKYASLQMSGARDYREMLLVMPPRTKVDYALQARLSVELKKEFFHVCCDGQPFYGQPPYPTQAQAKSAITRLVESSEQVYTSPHWPGANVLAHVRLNEREDKHGQRTLFIEEVQSDWGQQGRRKGFVGDETTIADMTASQWRMRAQDLFGKWTNELDPVFSEWKNAIANAQLLLTKYRAMGLPDNVEIPSGPFVTATQNWLNLALKRIVGYAVENGFDQVAFASGDQLVERFAMSRDIRCINWSRTDEGTYIFDVLEDKAVCPKLHTNASATQLERHIGKLLAEQIFVNANKSGSLSGLTVKVGGEGMRRFYDVMVPGALRNLVHRLGGDGLCSVEFETGGKTCIQAGFIVTAGMRETVMQGMPLFSYPELYTAVEDDLVEQPFA